jgi:hypothetical protein
MGNAGPQSLPLPLPLLYVIEIWRMALLYHVFLTIMY